MSSPMTQGVVASICECGLSAIPGLNTCGPCYRAILRGEPRPARVASAGAAPPAPPTPPAPIESPALQPPRSSAVTQPLAAVAPPPRAPALSLEELDRRGRTAKVAGRVSRQRPVPSQPLPSTPAAKGAVTPPAVRQPAGTGARKESPLTFHTVRPHREEADLDLTGDGDAHALHGRLKNVAFLDGGRLPADEQDVRKRASVSAALFRKAWPKVRKKWPLDDSGTFRFNPELLEEIARARALVSKRSDAGREGAAARYGKKELRADAPRQSDSSSMRLPPDGELGIRNEDLGREGESAALRGRTSGREPAGGPSLEAVLTFAKKEGYPDNSARCFWLHHEGSGWRGIVDWRPRLEKWVAEDAAKASPARPSSRLAGKSALPAKPEVWRDVGTDSPDWVQDLDKRAQGGERMDVLSEERTPNGLPERSAYVLWRKGHDFDGDPTGQLSEKATDGECGKP